MAALDDTLIRLQDQAAKQAIRVTQHAQEEMDAEEITLDEVLGPSRQGRYLRIMLSIGVGHVACFTGVPKRDARSISFVLQRNHCSFLSPFTYRSRPNG